MLAIDLGNFDDGDIKRASTQIINRDLRITALLVHAIRQRGRGRLVDDTFDLETGDSARIFGSLTLGVVKVGRHRDDGLGNRLTEIVLGGLFHLHQDSGRDLGGRHLFTLHLYPRIAVVSPHYVVGHHLDVALHHVVGELPPDKALDGEQGIVRVGDGLAFCGLSRQYLVVFGESDN